MSEGLEGADKGPCDIMGLSKAVQGFCIVVCGEYDHRKVPNNKRSTIDSGVPGAGSLVQRAEHTCNECNLLTFMGWKLRILECAMMHFIGVGSMKCLLPCKAQEHTAWMPA